MNVPDSHFFVERTGTRHPRTKVVPFSKYRFLVPTLLYPIHKLDALIKFHVRKPYRRRALLKTSRQHKMNTLRSLIRDKNKVWDVADDVRLKADYRERNRLSARKDSWAHYKDIVNARGDSNG